jgi:hypothetical protein
MVYGIPLTLPGEFLASPEPPPASFLQDLREAMSVFQPPTVRRYSEPVSTEVPASLQKADLVYIRRGEVLKPLDPLYEGPYRVIDKSQKYFRLEIGGRVEAVSTDCL